MLASGRRPGEPKYGTAGGSRLAQVAAHEHVVAEPLDVDMCEIARRRKLAERARPAAGERRSDEQEQLVDEPGREKRARQRRPALEQQRTHALRAQRRELRLETSVPQLELRP